MLSEDAIQNLVPSYNNYLTQKKNTHKSSVLFYFNKPL